MVLRDGSSPLARGLLTPKSDSSPWWRIIPARAGFTSASRSRTRSSPDHPRSRGVYRTELVDRCLSHGSSPLARGLRANSHRDAGILRIIPARAGFTYRDPAFFRITPDHPRSRGVYLCLPYWVITPPGSSPLARGLRGGRSVETDPGGIIPARAGFTEVPHDDGFDGQDHPRSRGVYRNPKMSTIRKAGSSPLARGLLRGLVNRIGSTRIIPARAGFTRNGSGRVPLIWDHPRSRGVYNDPITVGIAQWGSSPLARGLPEKMEERLDSVKDHPRSRGVYPVEITDTLSGHGSSPLARGLQPDAQPPQPPTRIIPARAGFTPSTFCPSSAARDHPRSRGVYQR